MKNTIEVHRRLQYVAKWSRTAQQDLNAGNMRLLAVDLKALRGFIKLALASARRLEKE